MLKRMLPFQLVFFAILFLSLSFGKSDALAAVDCSVASLIRVGALDRGGNNVAVFLQNKTSANVGTWKPNEVRMYILSGPISNQALAVFLTAFTMNKTTYVVVQGSAAAGSLISAVYVNQ